MSRPQRIRGFSYVGLNIYFITCCVKDRRPVFEDRAAVDEALDHFRRTARENEFEILTYCFMPDHLHLLVEGVSDRSDLRKCMKLAKQRSGAAYALRGNGALWQEGYYDRVVRPTETPRHVARYILENPVRANLVVNPQDYAHSGSDKWPMKDLLESVR